MPVSGCGHPGVLSLQPTERFRGPGEKKLSGGEDPPHAARNHLGRSSSGVIDVYKSRETVLRILTERFLSHAERIPRLYSKAESLLPANPYFRGYPPQLKGFS